MTKADEKCAEENKQIKKNTHTKIETGNAFAHFTCNNMYAKCIQ